MACSPSRVSREWYSCIRSAGSTQKSGRAGRVHTSPEALPALKHTQQGPLTCGEHFLHSLSHQRAGLPQEPHLRLHLCSSEPRAGPARLDLGQGISSAARSSPFPPRTGPQNGSSPCWSSSLSSPGTTRSPHPGVPQAQKEYSRLHFLEELGFGHGSSVRGVTGLGRAELGPQAGTHRGTVRPSSWASGGRERPGQGPHEGCLALPNDRRGLPRLWDGEDAVRERGTEPTHSGKY